MRPVIASGIVTGDAPVSFWPLFEKTKKSFKIFSTQCKRHDNPVTKTHHCSRMFPFRKFLQYPHKIDTRKQVPPTAGLLISIFL